MRSALAACLVLQQLGLGLAVRSQSYQDVMQLARDDAGNTDTATIVCTKEELASKSTYIGAGGNAYVLRLTANACGGKKDEVLKAFIDESSRNEALDTLAGLPQSCSLAGLPCGASTKSQCMMESKCVNSKGFGGWGGDTRDCFYLRMKNGGTKTVEQCLGQTGTGALTADKVKFLLKAAVTALQCIQSAGYYHSDYQLKNIMLGDSCNSADMKVVDLDGMRAASTNSVAEGTSGEVWNAAHYAWKDFTMIFGVCGTGALEVEKMWKGSAEKTEKDKVKNLRTQAEAILCLPDSPDPWKQTWSAATNARTGYGAKLLAALR